MQKKDQAANSGVEHQSEEGVIDEVTVHDAAPEEVAVCTQGGTQSDGSRGGLAHAPNHVLRMKGGGPERPKTAV